MIVHVQYFSYLVWGCLSVHLWQTRQGNGTVSPGILARKVGLGVLLRLCTFRVSIQTSNPFKKIQ